MLLFPSPTVAVAKAEVDIDYGRIDLIRFNPPGSTRLQGAGGELELGRFGLRRARLLRSDGGVTMTAPRPRASVGSRSRPWSVWWPSS